MVARAYNADPLGALLAAGHLTEADLHLIHTGLPIRKATTFQLVEELFLRESDDKNP